MRYMSNQFISTSTASLKCQYITHTQWINFSAQNRNECWKLACAFQFRQVLCSNVCAGVKGYMIERERGTMCVCVCAQKWRMYCFERVVSPPLTHDRLINCGKLIKSPRSVDEANTIEMDWRVRLPMNAWARAIKMLLIQLRKLLNLYLI